MPRRNDRDIVYFSEAMIKEIDEIIRYSKAYYSREAFITSAVKEKIARIPKKDFSNI
ncbi:hypothetical protein [[Eubacterium] cellulosolvens]